MIDFSPITTILFDIDQTLLLFDDQEFIKIYVKLIHGYFKEEQPSFSKFIDIFLTSTNKMTEKSNPELDNLSKFAVDFESRIGISQSDIIHRFDLFYHTEFAQVCQIMKAHHISQKLLSLASNHFLVVAATNPLFPSVANEIRLKLGGLDMISWSEVTSAEDYHYTKPYIEFFEELLNKINKDPHECIMVGDDPINDMVAGELGIKTFLIIKTDGRAFDNIIKIDPEYENKEFPHDYSGSLEDFYCSLKNFIEAQ